MSLQRAVLTNHFAIVSIKVRRRQQVKGRFVTFAGRRASGVGWLGWDCRRKVIRRCVCDSFLAYRQLRKRGYALHGITCCIRNLQLWIDCNWLETTFHGSGWWDWTQHVITLGFFVIDIKLWQQVSRKPLLMLVKTTVINVDARIKSSIVVWISHTSTRYISFLFLALLLLAL